MKALSILATSVLIATIGAHAAEPGDELTDTVAAQSSPNHSRTLAQASRDVIAKLRHAARSGNTSTRDAIAPSSDEVDPDAHLTTESGASKSSFARGGRWGDQRPL